MNSKAVGLFADQLTGAAKSTERYVRSNPWQAAGALAVVGLATGLALSHRTRRLLTRPFQRRRADLSGAASEVMGG
jgi:hypothetical protein